MAKKILMGLLALFVIIQFIRPTKNQSEKLSEADISYTYSIPTDIHQTLVKKCYDCHSNNTNYPWYNNIQPVAWWLNSHITEGKNHLNFSDFKNYSEKKAKHKLEEVGEMLVEDEMPLKSYLLLHGDAVVTSQEKEAIYSWINSQGVTFKREAD